MIVYDQEFCCWVYEEVEKNEFIVNSDLYCQYFYIMLLVGLLNDLNGVIYWKGSYYVFFQWQLFQMGYGVKFWGYYMIQDVVNWKWEEIVFVLSDWFDKNGCYLGSVVMKDGWFYLFYIGNVRDQDGNWEIYQCFVVFDDGLFFEKKGVVVCFLEGYMVYFCDLKVWEYEGIWYMVIGV